MLTLYYKARKADCASTCELEGKRFWLEPPNDVAMPRSFHSVDFSLWMWFAETSQKWYN